MVDFKRGDIVTGIPGNGYSITTERALMIVSNIINDNEMTVRVLFHDSGFNCLGDSHDVDNTTGRFILTTFEDFLAEYPDCYKLSESDVNYYLARYASKVRYKEQPNPLDELYSPYVLADDKRKELLDEMKTLLKKYHYHPTEDGLNEIINEWCKNKGYLIRLFEKHPNYNGKFQIAFDHDFDRTIDANVIYAFRNWLCSNDVQSMYKKEVQVGDFTYKELYKRYYEARKAVNIFFGYDFIKTINDKPFDWYTEERDFTDALLDKNYTYNPNITVNDSKAYDKKLYDNIYKIDNLCCILTSSDAIKSQFVNEYAEKYFNRHFPKARIKQGQKMSRAVNKILGSIGVNKHADYNKEFAKYADAVNPLTVKRHTVISVHPVDFLTNSFGNSWSSCMTIDKTNDRGIDEEHSWHGGSSSGVMSYMLDNSTCTLYTVSAEYDGDTLELEDKINRNLFHYYDNQLIQGRVYPQSNDCGAGSLYTNIREIAQKVFADCLEVPNYWTIKTGTSACGDVSYSSGTHYTDYLEFSTCNVSTLKDDRRNHRKIRIGHDPICPCCGCEHTRNNNIECEDCNY